MAKQHSRKQRDIEELESAYQKITKRKPAKRKKHPFKNALLFLGILALVAIIVVGVGGYFLNNYLYETKTINAPVTIMGVNVQGMNRKQATDALSHAFDALYGENLMGVSVGEDYVSLPASVVSLNITKLVDDAIAYAPDSEDSEVFPIGTYIKLDKKAVLQILDPVLSKYQSTLTQTKYEISGDRPESQDSPNCQKLIITVGTPEIRVDKNALYEAILNGYRNGEFTVSYKPSVKNPDKLDLSAVFQKHCTTPVNAAIDPVTKEVIKEVYGYGFSVEAVEKLLAPALPGQVLTATFSWIKPEITEEMLPKQDESPEEEYTPLPPSGGSIITEDG